MASRVLDVALLGASCIGLEHDCEDVCVHLVDGGGVAASCCA